MSTHLTSAVRRIERLTFALAVLVTVTVTAATAVVLVAAHDGYRAVEMTTGSMAPAVSPGDLAVIRETDPASVRAGDVITFSAPIAGSPVVTHRVVAVRLWGGVPEFTTKGDNNQSPDPWTVRYTSRAWTVTTVLPGVGSLITFLQGTGGRVLTGVLIFLIVFGLLAVPSRTSRERVASVEGARA